MTSTSPEAYDGKTQTYYMSLDEKVIGYVSSAADIANNEVLNIKNKSYRGFVGAKQQLELLIDNYLYVYNCAQTLGYSCVYYDNSIWTSSCYSDGKKPVVWMHWSSLYYWNSYDASGIFYILPFFYCR